MGGEKGGWRRRGVLGEKNLGWRRGKVGREMVSGGEVVVSLLLCMLVARDVRRDWVEGEREEEALG